MKICVYAICKNEEKYVDSWMDSMLEADGVFVLDTGSSDKTVEMLRERGANVTVHSFGGENGEFRFDVARNMSLDLVPNDVDICVCTDLDEIFTKGWREELEKQWIEGKKKIDGLNSAYYDYIHTYDRNGNPVKRFLNFKIHTRNGVKWDYPCHEVPVYENGRKTIVLKNVTLMHHQDLSKPRSDLYLHLLEIGAQEKPEDARAQHYLGREYMYRERWDDAIRVLKQQLDINGSWIVERAQAMRFIARCYKKKGKEFHELAECWYQRGITEDPTHRESAVELSQMALDDGNFELGEHAAEEALRVKVKTDDYITEEASWGYLPYDYLSIGESCRKTVNFHRRARAVSRALELNKFDKRIWKNLINCNGRSIKYPVAKEVADIINEYKNIQNESSQTIGSSVNWDMFDKIYCIHYVHNTNREPMMKNEFCRVGLWGRENFEVVETVRTSYEERFLSGECKGILNLAINTLRCLLRSQAHGHKRILIFEDDVRFLNDMRLFSDIFNSSPDKDIVVYDKMMYVYPVEYYQMCEKNKINKHFCSWEHGMYSGSCYSLSDKGIEACISAYNKKLQAPDDIIQVDGVTKAFSYVNTSCQQVVEGAMYPERFGGYNHKNGYAFQGLDFSMYNVDEGYDYDGTFTDDDILNS